MLVELHNSNKADLTKLYDRLRQYHDAGMSKDEMYACLEELRKACDSEAAEEMVLELMDFVTGFCSPYVMLFPEKAIGELTEK